MWTGLVLKACNFAADKHKHQKRKADGSSFTLGVAWLLYDLGQVQDPTILISAVLHDTIEDTDTTLVELTSEFGATVASIVAEVSDDKSKPVAERKRSQVSRAASLSTEAKLVKLADKLHKTRDLQRLAPPGWSVGRVQGYFIWSKAVVDQMRGTNEAIESALDDVFHGTFEVEGSVYPCVPEGDLLGAYYTLFC